MWEIASEKIPWGSLCIFKRSFELSPLNPFVWLAQQTVYPKIYWDSIHTSMQRAAAGNVWFSSHFPKQPLPSGIRLFTTLPFPRKGQKNIGGFFLPQYEVEHTTKTTYLHQYSLNKGMWPNPEEAFGVSEHPFAAKATVKCVKFLTDYDRWVGQVDHVLHLIRQGDLRKVVLGRASLCTLTSPPSYQQCIEWLYAHKRSGSIFSVQWEPHHLFFGQSPETLYRRNKGIINADALAGTSTHASEEVLWTLKIQEEIDAVKGFLEKQITPLAESFQWLAEDQIRKTPTLAHRYNQITAVLYPSTTDAQLIQQLHPTPALGGYPVDRALKTIASMEPLARGLYGGIVGHLSAESAEMGVCIRAASVRGKQMLVWAGAGIVSGSLAHEEWEEVNWKSAPYHNFTTYNQTSDSIKTSSDGDEKAQEL